MSRWILQHDPSTGIILFTGSNEHYDLTATDFILLSYHLTPRAALQEEIFAHLKHIEGAIHICSTHAPLVPVQSVKTVCSDLCSSFRRL